MTTSPSYQNGLNGGSASEKQDTHQKQNIADTQFKQGQRDANR